MLQFDKTDLDYEVLTLIRKVGIGKYIQKKDFYLSLDYQPVSPQPLLCLSAKLNEHYFELWVEENQWLEWIESVLPVCEFENIPSEFLSILIDQTIAELNSWLQSVGLARLSMSSIERNECSATYAWIFTLKRESHELRVYLTNPPLNWLLQLVDYLEESNAYFTTPYTIPISLIVGWTWLNLGELRHLKPGEGIALGHVCAVDSGQAWLYLSRPIAKLVFDHPDLCRIEEMMMDEFDDWMDIEKPTPVEKPTPAIEEETEADEQTNTVPIDALTVQMVAEIGRIEMPISDLVALAPGNIIQAASRFDQNVKLKINGKVIATGSLLQVENQFVVRIERIG